MFFSLTLSIDKNVIEIYNNKDVKLVHKDIVDIALKYGWCIGQAKKHYLVFKKAVTGLKGHFLFYNIKDLIII